MLVEGEQRQKVLDGLVFHHRREEIIKDEPFMRSPQHGTHRRWTIPVAPFPDVTVTCHRQRRLGFAGEVRAANSCEPR